MNPAWSRILTKLEFNTPFESEARPLYNDIKIIILCRPVYWWETSFQQNASKEYFKS